MRENIELNNFISKLVNVDCINHDQKLAIVNKIQTLEGLEIDVEYGEDSPYHPYRIDTYSLMYNNDVILELDETFEGEHRLLSVNEKLFIESLTLGVEVLNGTLDPSYTESCNIER